MLPYLSKESEIQGFYFPSTCSYQSKPTSIIDYNHGLKTDPQRCLNQDKNYETQTNSNNSQEVLRSNEAFQPHVLKTNQYGLLSQRDRYGSYCQLNSYGSDLQLTSKPKLGENPYLTKIRCQNNQDHYGHYGYNPQLKKSSKGFEKYHKFLSLLDRFLSIQIKCDQFDAFDKIQERFKNGSKKFDILCALFKKLLLGNYRSVFRKLEFNSMDHSEVEKKDDDCDNNSDARTFMKHFPTKIDMLAEYNIESDFSQGENQFHNKTGGTSKDLQTEPKTRSQIQYSPQQEKEKKKMFHFNTNIRKKNFDVFNNYGFGGGDLFKQHTKKRLKKQRSQQLQVQSHTSKIFNDNSLQIAPALMDKSSSQKQVPPFTLDYQVQTNLSEKPLSYESQNDNIYEFERRKQIFQLHNDNLNENYPDFSTAPVEQYDILEKIYQLDRNKNKKEKQLEKKRQRNKQEECMKKIEERTRIEKLLRQKEEQIQRMRQKREKTEEKIIQQREYLHLNEKQKTGMKKKFQNFDPFIKNVDSLIEKKLISKEPSQNKKDGFSSLQFSIEDAEKEERMRKLEGKKWSPKPSIQQEELKISFSKQLLKQQSNLKKRQQDRPRSFSTMITEVNENYGVKNKIRESKLEDEPTRMKFRPTSFYHTPHRKDNITQQERSDGNSTNKDGDNNRLFMDPPSRRQTIIHTKQRINSCLPKYTHSPSPAQNQPQRDEVKIYFTISSPTHDEKLKHGGNTMGMSPSHYPVNEEYGSRKRVIQSPPPPVTQYYGNLGNTKPPQPHVSPIQLPLKRTTNFPNPQQLPKQPMSPQYKAKQSQSQHYYMQGQPHQPSPQKQPAKGQKSKLLLRPSSSHKKIKILSTRKKH